MPTASVLPYSFTARVRSLGSQASLVSISLSRRYFRPHPSIVILCPAQGYVVITGDEFDGIQCINQRYGVFFLYVLTPSIYRWRFSHRATRQEYCGLTFAVAGGIGLKFIQCAYDCRY